MDIDEVKAILEDMGLEVKIQEIEPDSTTCSVIGQNLVISQSLDEGSEVKSGDEITLTILQDITFPDWYLKTEAEVTSWANNACVTVTTEYQDTTDTNMAGKVITQSRPNGSTVRNNDSVTITIGRLVESNEDEEPPVEEDSNNDNNNSNSNQPSTQGE